MTTKVVCRLLDAAGVLLGWSEVMAVARGDGRLWSPGPVSIYAEQSGASTELSVHWCDVNVETRVPFTVSVAQGHDVIVAPQAVPLLVVGSPAGGLPAVTVRRRVAVSVPVGTLGARR